MGLWRPDTPNDVRFAHCSFLHTADGGTASRKTLRFRIKRLKSTNVSVFMQMSLTMENTHQVWAPHPLTWVTWRWLMQIQCDVSHIYKILKERRYRSKLNNTAASSRVYTASHKRVWLQQAGRCVHLRNSVVGNLPITSCMYRWERKTWLNERRNKKIYKAGVTEWLMRMKLMWIML